MGAVSLEYKRSGAALMTTRVTQLNMHCSFGSEIYEACGEKGNNTDFLHHQSLWKHVTLENPPQMQENKCTSNKGTNATEFL